ncbi:hypothetical protein AUP68_14348 [Ilyonectria robusta]
MTAALNSILHMFLEGFMAIPLKREVQFAPWKGWKRVEGEATLRAYVAADLEGVDEVRGDFDPQYQRPQHVCK